MRQKNFIGTIKVIHAQGFLGGLKTHGPGHFQDGHPRYAGKDSVQGRNFYDAVFHDKNRFRVPFAHVKNYIGTLIKKAENGTLEPAVVNCIVNALDKALKCIELMDYGAKLDMLMKQVQSVRGVRMVQDAECLDVEEDTPTNPPGG